MKWIYPYVIIILILSQGLSAITTGVRINEFDDKKSEVVKEFLIPNYLNVINISLPAECYVLNATLNLCGMPAENDLSLFPSTPSIWINNTILWSFGGIDYGAFGKQESFQNGIKEKLGFILNGGSNSTRIRLPKDAEVFTSSMEINCMGHPNYSSIINLTEIDDHNGDPWHMTSWAGDVNDDGISDILVGQWGRALLFLGNMSHNDTPDLIFSNYSNGITLSGWQVSSAGDMNGDGYDDVICGVYNEESPGGGNLGETAFIYFGNKSMDNEPDVILNGSEHSAFGVSVSKAGDVNGDGFDDVIVGAPYDNASGIGAGRAFIYLGGKTVDSIPDIILASEDGNNTMFGSSVACAGDVNGDGYDDIIVNQFNPSKVYIFFGGPNMDAKHDVVLNSINPDDYFSLSISGAGDVNGDGFDDVIVSGPYYSAADKEKAGRVYIYLGGPNMDINPDIVITGLTKFEELGYSVSCAGDINKDGYADVILGAPSPMYSKNCGSAYILFGGSNMDNRIDVTLNGENSGSELGYSVSGHGDINGDGFDDVAVLAPKSGIGLGKVYIVGGAPSDAMNDPRIRVGNQSIFNGISFMNNTRKVPDFSSTLNSYLRSAAICGSDAFGNDYVDVPIIVETPSAGNITLSTLNITYIYNATVQNFSKALNKYIANNRNNDDPGGNITIPLELKAASKGRIKAFSLNISIDEAPYLLEKIPDYFMDEDTANANLIDLTTYYNDDYDSFSNLTFAVMTSTNSSIVNTSIKENRYVSVDALTGSANDNWTGEIKMKIMAMDSRGLRRVSNEFRILIQNVNDPPLIISEPMTNATISTEYEYQINAIDGDGDTLVYTLASAPEGMIINRTSGLISWTPKVAGNFSVFTVVSDGNLTAVQNYSILVIDTNHAPRFISISPTKATVGKEIIYPARAIDDDGDPIVYSLVSNITGMTIEMDNGIFKWTPTTSQIGNQSITLKAFDGKTGETYQTFIINVMEKIPPSCIIISPALNAKVSGKMNVSGRAINGTDPIIQVRLRVNNKEWLNASGIDNWTFTIDTSQLKNGKYNISAMAYDGSIYSESTSVNIFVNNPEPRVSVEGTFSWIAVVVIGVTVSAMFVLVIRSKRKK